MPARGWHCLQGWWGQHPPASTPGGGGWPRSWRGAGIHSQNCPPPAAGHSLPAGPRHQISPAAGQALLSLQNVCRVAGRSSKAGRQISMPTSTNSPLHQASHGCVRPQLLPGDARAEGHQIPAAAGEDPGEHPHQCQRLPGPAGSRPCHDPGQRQHQRVQTAQRSR